MTITLLLAAVAAYLVYRSDVIALLLSLPDSNDDFDFFVLDQPKLRSVVQPQAEPPALAVIPANAGIHTEAPVPATAK